ncbi:MAG: hypothetical protein KDA61_05105 [Planctomycetales bacterium]|nr:hypothetical protein [Planctomycetales bacterium]
MSEMRRIEVEISPGEMFDKITILEIKSERMSDAGKRANVELERRTLAAVAEPILQECAELASHIGQLKQVNESLWDIEDEIRRCELAGDFGDRFIELARSVYQTNDDRAAIKRRINVLLGSQLVEEKEYVEYKAS